LVISAPAELGVWDQDRAGRSSPDFFEYPMRYQTDPNYRWRGMIVRLPLFAASAIFLALAFIEIRDGAPVANSWSGLFVASTIAGLAFEIALRRSYRCPRCRTALPPARLMAIGGEDEYVHECESCGIAWRTLTHPPEP
jgi:hypothetical protein